LPPAKQQGVDSLQRRVDALDQQLVLRLPEYGRAFNALRVAWPQVQATLKPDEAAIEFVAFNYYHKRWTDSTFYVALVLRPGWATPRLVFLTEQKSLDSLVATGGAKRDVAYVNRLYGAADRGGVVEPAKGKPVRSLYSQVWQPIDSLLTGVKTIYYAPDGLLHRLNLAAVGVNSRQRLGNRYTLVRVASTRQVAVPELPTPTGQKRALLLGGIQYDRDSVAYRRANVRFARPITETQLAVRADQTTAKPAKSRGGYWDVLEETPLEIDTVGRLLRSAGYQTDTLSGLRASEEGFYHFVRLGGASPRVLHLATHGFLYDAPIAKPATDKAGPAEPESRFTQSQNALIRSGLALAGANPIFWLGQAVPSGQQDGVLTAYEIGLLRSTPNRPGGAECLRNRPG
jgi:CHAT domain